jgi:YidC/Oxa1 family membrane protein insertase
MNNRFFLALVLTAIVIVVTPRLFPTAGKPNPAATAIESARIDRNLPSRRQVPEAVPAILKVTPDSSVTPLNTSAARVETTTVHSSRATYGFSSRGGVPVSIALDSYPSHRKGLLGQKVELIGRHRALLAYQLISGRDTVLLDTLPLRVEQQNGPGSAVVYTGSTAGHRIRLAYLVPADTVDSYLMHVSASIENATAGSVLVISLPQTLQPNESDTVDDLNHLAVSYRSRGEINSVAFSKLDSLEARVDGGPISWIAIRNKYFVVAYRAVKTPFAAMRVQGVGRTGKIAEEMRGAVALPIGTDGSASFDIYAGPQSFERLQHLGNDLDQVNPYAGFLHGVVQPFTTIVMKALLWMKRTTQLNYGWVLVLFGVTIRLILWPLNQGAMRTSMKMQRLQPELQALQKKYSDDPKKQQEAVMKVYKDHGMSPLSPLMGCLPMLLPMPILFALYQVFGNTIEFRGVSFLWLADISQRDPYYITPLLMGASMFVMSWIGMRNAPPNPQAKMMSYMMPVMLTVLFLNFASGLNLYYAVQNIAAIPQQWLLARERGKQTPVLSGSLEQRRT